MRPNHIVIVNHDDGNVTFLCFFCGAQVGPFKPPPGGFGGPIEMTHYPNCVFIEAGYLNRLFAVQRVDN